MSQTTAFSETTQAQPPKKVSPLAQVPHWAWALLASLLVTLIYNRQLVLHVTTWLPQGGTDIYENVWNFWWMRHALFDLHTNPFYTTYLYYPAGVSLRLHSFQPLLSITAALLYYVFGQILTVNILILSSLTLGVFGAYLLSLYVSGSKIGAFAGGLVFVFCNSYLFDYLQSGQTNLIALEWLPLYTLCLLRAFDKKPRLKLNLALAVVCIVAASLCDWYYALHLILLTGVATAFYLVFRAKNWRERRDVFLKAAIIGIAYAVLISPFILPMLQLAHAEPWLAPSADQSVVHSADLLSFFVPNDHSPLYGWLATHLPLPFYQHYDPTTGQGFYNPTGVDGSFNPGLIPLVLAILAVVVAWRSRKSTENKLQIGLWVTLALFFGLLALGPVLQINGNTLDAIKLPYWVLYHIPGLNIARDPGNFLVSYDLALGVLTAVGVGQILKWLEKSPTAKRLRQPALLAGIAICFLIGIEFITVDLPVGIIPVPDFYKNIVAADKSDYAILELPTYKQSGGVEHFAMFYQTFHQKALFGGMLARDHKRVGPLDLIKHSYLFEEANLDSQAVTARPVDILPAPTVDKWATSILNYYNVKYLVLYPGSMSDDQLAQAQQFVKQAVGGNAQPVAKDSTIIAYAVPTATTAQQAPSEFIDIGQGWNKPETNSTSVWRWAKDSTAELYAMNLTKAPVKVTLHFSAFTFKKSRNLHLMLNNQPVANYQLNSDGGMQDFTLTVTLTPGNNVFGFSSPQPGVSPSSFDPNAHDNRVLTFALAKVSMQPAQ